MRRSAIRAARSHRRPNRRSRSAGSKEPRAAPGRPVRARRDRHLPRAGAARRSSVRSGSRAPPRAGARRSARRPSRLRARAMPGRSAHPLRTRRPARHARLRSPSADHRTGGTRGSSRAPNPYGALSGPSVGGRVCLNERVCGDAGVFARERTAAPGASSAARHAPKRIIEAGAGVEGSVADCGNGGRRARRRHGGALPRALVRTLARA